jgi:hypothetical protein
MNVVRPQVDQRDPTFFPARQGRKYLTEFLADPTAKRIAAELRYEHYVVFAFPARVR